MDQTAKRLWEAATDAPFNVESWAQIARMIGATDQVMSNWKSRGVPDAQIPELAARFQVEALWLQKGILPKRKGEDPYPKINMSVLTDEQRQSVEIDLSNNADLVPVARVKFKISGGITGFTIEPDTSTGKPIFFRRDWFDLNGYKPEALFSVRVNGDSMDPSLRNDDLVVVNTLETTPIDGEVYALNYEGELVIKRLRRDSGEWWATSDNADQRRFAPKRCTEDVKVLGKVIYKQSERI